MTKFAFRTAMVIGGIASGKSRIAERLVNETRLAKTYLATAQADDDEMRSKIARHQAQRKGDGWATIEEPLAITDAFATQGITLVDCLTMWLSNLTMKEADLTQHKARLTQAIGAHDQPLVFVTNELGQGGIADNAMMRRFQREQGILNQEIAQLSDLVIRVDAGIPTPLKGRWPERRSA